MVFERIHMVLSSSDCVIQRLAAAALVAFVSPHCRCWFSFLEAVRLAASVELSRSGMLGAESTYDPGVSRRVKSPSQAEAAAE